MAGRRRLGFSALGLAGIDHSGQELVYDLRLRAWLLLGPSRGALDRTTSPGPCRGDRQYHAALIETLVDQALVAADIRDPDLEDRHLTAARALRDLNRIRRPPNRRRWPPNHTHHPPKPPKSPNAPRRRSSHPHLGQPHRHLMGVHHFCWCFWQGVVVVLAGR